MRPAALLLVLGLACGRAADYTAVGDVVGVDELRSEVTIRHDDIPGLMGAMTMRFPVRAPEVLAGTAPGTRVRFDLLRQGTRLVVTRVVRIGPAGAARPGIHDHTPHHGGVVSMVGMIHLEAAAAPTGAIRVYLTDVWRRPLPVADVTGSVTIGLPDGTRDVPLVARDGALEAAGPPLASENVAAHVRLARAGEAIEAHFVLSLGGDRSGAADAPLEGCVPPVADPGAQGRRPRCTLTFHQPVTAIGVLPDASAALVAVVNGGVSVWAMPAATFRLGFAPPPPVAAPADAPPHPDAIAAMAVSPDGRETVLAVENRLLVHATASGALLRELPAFHGVIRAVAWSADGTRLLVTLFYDATAHVLAADDGHELARVGIEREGAAVAFASGGRAAIGSEVGPIMLVDFADAHPPTVLTDVQRPIAALAFAGDRLVSGTSDGLLRVWDAGGTITARAETAPGLVRLAVAPGARLVATAGLDRTIRLNDLASGALVEAIAWHRAAIWGLAWAGSTLVSGDSDGRVALWDLADRLGP